MSKLYDPSTDYIRIGFIFYVMLQRKENVLLFIVFIFKYVSRDRSRRFLAYTKTYRRDYRA